MMERETALKEKQPRAASLEVAARIEPGMRTVDNSKFTKNKKTARARVTSPRPSLILDSTTRAASRAHSQPRSGSSSSSSWASAASGRPRTHSRPAPTCSRWSRPRTARAPGTRSARAAHPAPRRPSRPDSHASIPRRSPRPPAACVRPPSWSRRRRQASGPASACPAAQSSASHTPAPTAEKSPWSPSPLAPDSLACAPTAPATKRTCRR
eukprot:797242-Rhodomonas_salina.1